MSSGTAALGVVVNFPFLGPITEVGAMERRVVANGGGINDYARTSLANGLGDQDNNNTTARVVFRDCRNIGRGEQSGIVNDIRWATPWDGMEMR